MVWQVNDNKVLRQFAKVAPKEEIFHTSTYGAAQSGATIGTGGDGISVEKRHEMEMQRKFVKDYNNAKIMEGTYAIRKATQAVPRTEGGYGSLRSNTTGDASGNVRTGYGKSDGPVQRGYGRTKTEGDARGNRRGSYGRSEGSLNESHSLGRISTATPAPAAPSRTQKMFQIKPSIKPF